MSEAKTPCEELGYELGDLFVKTGDDNLIFKQGSVVQLIEDDNTDMPYFLLVKGECDEPNDKGYDAISLYSRYEASTRQVGALIDTQEKWEQMREGDVVEFVGFRTGLHDHWSFPVGCVRNVEKDEDGNMGPRSDDGAIPWENYSDDLIFKYVSLVDDNSSKDDPEKPQEHKFKTGDKVKPSPEIEGDYGYGCSTEMEEAERGGWIGEVVGVDCDDEHILVSFDGGDSDWSYLPSELTLVETDLEYSLDKVEEQVFQDALKHSGEIVADEASVDHLSNLVNTTNTSVTIYSADGHTRFSIMRGDNDLQAAVDSLEDVIEILEALKVCENVVGKYEWL